MFIFLLPSLHSKSLDESANKSLDYLKTTVHACKFTEGKYSSYFCHLKFCDV